MRTWTNVVFVALIFLNQALAIDVTKKTNSESCSGMVLSFFNQGSEYITFKKMPELSTALKKVYPDQSKWTTSKKYINSFFKNLLSREVLQGDVVEPLKSLKEGELYTFVMTKNEMRFASTSRAALSPKNFATKHALIANGDEIHFAGEAWVENGVLVVNHNSGTFRPLPGFLGDLAMYLQRSLKVERVLFSDFIPIVEEKSLKDRLKDLEAYVRRKGKLLSEGLINLISIKSYKGEVFSTGLDGEVGKDVFYRVGEVVNSDFSGVTYKLEIIGLSKKGKTFQPLLNDSGLVRDDLTVKFPHHIPILGNLPRFNMFSAVAIKDEDQLKQLQEIVANFETHASEHVQSVKFKGSKINISKFQETKSVQEMAKSSPALNADQKVALKRDVFDLAEVVKDKMGISLNINVENVGWSPERKRFFILNLSLDQEEAPLAKQGFKKYNEYFNQKVGEFFNNRKPSSTNSLTLCPASPFKIQDEFKKSFSTSLFENSLNLNLGELNIGAEEEFACFSVVSYDYSKDIAIMTMSMASKVNPEDSLQINLILDQSRQKYFSSFDIIRKGDSRASSLITPAQAQ